MGSSLVSIATGLDFPLGVFTVAGELTIGVLLTTSNNEVSDTTTSGLVTSFAVTDFELFACVEDTLVESASEVSRTLA